MENSNENMMEFLPKRPQMSVPEGYFDALPDRIMSKIDGKDTTKRVKRGFLFTTLHPYMSTAACLMIIVIGITALLINKSNVVSTSNYNTTNDYNMTIDQVADYMMIDNSEIYTKLSEQTYL